MRQLNDARKSRGPDDNGKHNGGHHCDWWQIVAGTKIGGICAYTSNHASQCLRQLMVGLQLEIEYSTEEGKEATRSLHARHP